MVQRARSGQSAQAAPNVAVRVLPPAGRVTPFGQVTVTVPSWPSWTVKSSIVNPPGTAGRIGHGLMIASCPRAWNRASASPLP